jgi:hypothetical protein
MNIADCKIVKDGSGEPKGIVCVPDEFSFEIYGPFGQGFNIRVRRSFKSAELSYHWRDGPGAFVKTPEDTYEISDTAVSQPGKVLLRLKGNGDFEPINDKFALALFVVHHFYANKTGPFSRQNA